VTTIGDVARRAGVSASTVSYVITGKRRLSVETTRRVERAIAELGYRPHAGARALASARTHLIGLVAPLRVGVDVNVIMQFVAGVTQGARAHELDVLLLPQDDGTDLARVTAASMIDALVVMDVEADDPRLTELAALARPVVLIGVPDDSTALTCIDLDFERAGALAVEHLAERGHRRVALLGSPREVLRRHTAYAERMTRGFDTAADRLGLDHVVVPTTSSVAGAYRAVDELVDAVPDVTGLVVHNEIALPHVVARLRELGRAVPDDVSVVAVCPENVTLSLPVPVTSIDIPAELIGRTAVAMLVAAGQQDAPAEVRLLRPRLTDRGTVRHVGPPAG